MEMKGLANIPHQCCVTKPEAFDVLAIDEGHSVARNEIIAGLRGARC